MGFPVRQRKSIDFFFLFSFLSFVSFSLFFFCYFLSGRTNDYWVLKRIANLFLDLRSSIELSVIVASVTVASNYTKNLCINRRTRALNIVPIFIVSLMFSYMCILLFLILTNTYKLANFAERNGTVGVPLSCGKWFARFYRRLRYS